MKIRILLASVLIGCVTWFALPTVSAQQKEPNDTKLHKLLTQKHDALKKRFDYIKATYDDGTASYDTVLLAHDLVLKAELELTPTKEARLLTCKKRIENFRFLERLATEEFKSGFASADNRLLATANRIQAEIDYLREESNTN